MESGYTIDTGRSKATRRLTTMLREEGEKGEKEV